MSSNQAEKVYVHEWCPTLEQLRGTDMLVIGSKDTGKTTFVVDLVAKFSASTETILIPTGEAPRPDREAETVAFAVENAVKTNPVVCESLPAPAVFLPANNTADEASQTTKTAAALCRFGITDIYATDRNCFQPWERNLTRIFVADWWLNVEPAIRRTADYIVLVGRQDDRTIQNIWQKVGSSFDQTLTREQFANAIKEGTTNWRHIVIDISAKVRQHLSPAKLYWSTCTAIEHPIKYCF